MDYLFGKQLLDNGLSYKRSLDRIIEKYSKIQNHDGGIEVDLGNIKNRALSRYMKQSKAELDKLDSQRPTVLSDESVRAQDTTEYSQLDFTLQSCGADETCVSGVSRLSSVSSTHISVQDEGELLAAGMCRNDTTQLTVGSLDESRRSVTEVEQQPEDQDQELERTLRSQGSLVELYPSMINRIGRAVHQQHISEAADSVLRRYRRLRQQPNRSLNLSNTFMSNQSKIILERRRRRRKNSGSPGKRRLMGTESSPHPHLQVITNQQEWKQQSPGRGRSSLRWEQHKPIVVIDLSGPPEVFKPKETPVNQTYTVSLDESQQGHQPSVYSVTPSQPSSSSLKAPLDLSLRSKRLFKAVHALQTDGYTSQTAKERPDIYGSPVRQSPTKNRLMRSLSRSPLASSRSLKVSHVERFSKEPVRPQISTFLSSPQQRTPLSPTILSSQDSNESFHLQLPPPRSTSAAESRHRLRRHLSFDSSMATSHVTHSPKKLDEDFIKLYHKFVCQHKSSLFKGPPCRFCGRSSEASRSYSSSSLAALALSPHRSILRKRHREPNFESQPQSKRFRDEYFSSSPGSRRYRKEMLRCPLYPHGSEQHYEHRSYSLSKLSEFQRFTHQQLPAEHHQDTWMSQSRHRPAAEVSGHGGPYERSAPSGSPRKWW